MIVKEENANRCGIFLYYDKEGVVDDYVIFLLDSLRPFLKHLLVVCNGPVNEEANVRLKKVADEVLIRENEGFDVGGYREGIFHIGLERLGEYDETIMFNYTFFGPLYPFGEMFDKMNGKDLDFWGITKHHKVDPDPFMANRYGFLPEHIQSHFLVLRKDFIKSKDYIDFITNLKNPTSYLESICEYESIFTKHFEDLGYFWDVYVNTDEYEGYAYCPIMFYLKDLIINKRCPIVKRRSFFTDYQDFMLNTCGESSVEAYDYIKENLDYDLNMVWDNLLRLENMTEISRVMHLNYMLPDQESKEEVLLSESAVFCYVESAKHIDNYQKYLREIPADMDLFWIGEKGVIDDIQSEAVPRKKQIIYIERNDYLEAFAKASEHFDQYEYICMVKMGDIEQAKPYSNFDSWQYRDWENLLGTSHIIRNVIASFRENTRLGCLIPPIPNHGDLFAIIGDGWKGKYDEVNKFLETVSVKRNIKKEDEPMAPFGGSFWMRTKAFAKRYFDQTDGDEDVFLMAIPFLVQEQGFYTGIGYNNKYAAIETTNQDYMMRELNKVVFEKYGPNYHKVVVDRIENNAIIRNAKLEAAQRNLLSKANLVLKRYLPKKIYYFIERCYVKLRS